MTIHGGFLRAQKNCLHSRGECELRWSFSVTMAPSGKRSEGRPNTTINFLASDMATSGVRWLSSGQQCYHAAFHPLSSEGFVKSLRQPLSYTVVAFVLILAGTVAAAGQQIDPKTYDAMKWRLVGPFRGGRVITVAGVPSQPNTYYFGAVGGGVWKTTDGGVSWDPLFDKQPISSIGAIAVADSDPNVIYAGTGEACIRGNISFGDGVYKSTDAGKTWTNVGLKDTRHIGAIVIHPTNPDIVYVAALGHAYGPNTERGIFRTRDGGKSWEKVLYLDDRTGAIDVVFDPQNPHILFASMWEGWRTPWTLNSGGAKDGLYRSTDDGTTWKRLEGEGLPEGPLGRIGVSVSGARSEERRVGKEC